MDTPASEPSPPRRVSAFVALGSNLGPRRDTLESALATLAAHPSLELRRTSPWFETAAEGGPPGQPDYLNGVAEFVTDLAPLELLDVLLDVEREHGRVRVAGERNAPRTLDLDLLLHGGETLRHERLVVPHPRMLERDFVLAPLARIAPRLRLPQTGRSVAEAAHRLALERIAAPWTSPSRPTAPVSTTGPAAGTAPPPSPVELPVA
jgi:2-amino-4-hydroxy-6-hydroxymethyldihydropteridine diphosphokinase